MSVAVIALIVIAAAAITAALIVVLRPLLKRYALARPNARSSHVAPTPQGGGIAVIAATLGVSAIAIFGWGPLAADPTSLSLVFAATALIALVGAVDDIRTLGVGPRLLLQALAVGMMLAALPADFRIAPWMPWSLERGILLIGSLWFVNLTNFMDGIDWMTVAEVVPMTAALGVLGVMGALPPYAVVVALALCGAVIGFAPFNKPVARLFLGDVGSLPIGLLLAWLLILLAGEGHVVAALLLPAYYLADATITLGRRLANRERVWEAHRTHFYQRATTRGFKVPDIVARVFAVNVLLALLAIASVLLPLAMVQALAIAAGVLLVYWLLAALARGRP
jgi:UDP-N-acetylmuramyl pentapeptide phosphotransferase/UDP-N-acetylglucosamine-1-phosphate transferase